jgi:diguanylate cyclase (GGDEF)-like protein
MRVFSGLRCRLALLVLLAALPALGLLLYTGQQSEILATEHALAESTRLVHLASADYERLVESTRQLLGTLARLPGSRARADCNTLFAELKESYSHYANLGAVRPDGRVYCSAVGLKGQVDVADRSYFRRALETRDFVVGDYQIGRITGKSVIVFGYPHYDKTSRLQSVIFAALDLAWLNRLASRAPLPKGTTLTILDSAGTILNHWPDTASWIGKSMADSTLSWTILASRGEGTTEAEGLDGVRRLYAFTPLLDSASGGRLYVSVGIPSDIGSDEIGRVMVRTLTGLAVVTVLVLIIAWYGGEFFLLRGIRILVDATQRLGRGDLSVRTGVAYSDNEIGQLTRSFDEMAENLQARENEARRAEMTIEHMAYHDALTGLPNRLLLLDRMRHSIIEAGRHGREVAVIVMDIDRFKYINDSQGHGTGDLLLKGVAERMMTCVRPGDTIARLSGDQFAILLADVAHVDDIGMVMQKITACYSQPLYAAGSEFFLTMSMGVTLYPHDGDEPEELLRHAEAAMYRASEQGGDNYQFYSAEMSAMASEHLAVETGLRHALERHELLLLYQPQVSLETGAVTGMEALLRWQSPEKGLVSPAKFIPLAEETGLILPIGEWVLRTACAQTRAWHEAGFRDLRISVNLSARQFREPGIVDVVSRILDETGLASRFLDIELTESLLIQHTKATHATLSRLHELGIILSIDDFGTGYSSLSYLKRLAIDVLKIDQSFVRDISTDQNDAAIVRAITTMARSLDVRTIAEGVETAEQLDYLRRHGCDEMQGYYFSKPLSAGDFTDLLRENRRLSVAESVIYRISNTG